MKADKFYVILTGLGCRQYQVHLSDKYHVDRPVLAKIDAGLSDALMLPEAINHFRQIIVDEVKAQNTAFDNEVVQSAINHIAHLNHYQDDTYINPRTFQAYTCADVAKLIKAKP